MKLAIVTGCTSGIGLALSKELKTQGYEIHGLARSKEKIEASGVDFKSFEIQDLTSSKNFEGLLNNLDVTPFEEVVLINNAGTLDPISQVEEVKYEPLLESFNVNTFAPIFLTQKFYRLLKENYDQKRKGRIINISTGAAFNGYAGWTAYCTTKAALWLFTQVCAAEFDKSICQVMAIAPGVVETNMQVLIRNQNEKDFPDVDRFKEMKNSGALHSTEVPAQYIAKILKEPSFPHAQHYDLRTNQL